MGTPCLGEPSCSRATIYMAGQSPTITECAIAKAGPAPYRSAESQLPAAFRRTGPALVHCRIYARKTGTPPPPARGRAAPENALTRGHLGDLDLDPELDFT